MKYLFTVLILILSQVLYAQRNNTISGTWVKCKVTFSNGSPLPDEDPLKYAYIKYSIESSSTFHYSTAYFELGNECSYEINNSFLSLRSPEGGLIHSFRIEKTQDTLEAIS